MGYKKNTHKKTGICLGKICHDVLLMVVVCLPFTFVWKDISLDTVCIISLS